MIVFRNGLVAGVGLDVEGYDVASTVVVANPDTNPHLALQEMGYVGDLLFVVGFVLPVKTVDFYTVVELPHAEGGEEAHQFDGWPVHERGDAVLL